MPQRSSIPLHPGAVEHYSDAEAYEARYQSRSEDIEYYLRRCRGAETVLEFGAGAGRLTIPLGKAGKRVTAVDTSAEMLTLLRRRLQQEEARVRGNIRVRQGDMRSFRSSLRFDQVVAAFHTLCHLYSREDIESFLRGAYRYLLPGGTLNFDLPLPRTDVPGYDPIAQVRVTEMEAPRGAQLLTQRWYQPQEIAMHLHYAGFRNVRLRADFTNSPIDAETSVFTVSAKKPRDGC